MMNWALAAVLGKWLFYLGLVILPGWLFFQLVSGPAEPPRRGNRPAWLALVIILTSMLACFLLLVQIGEINRNGITGMFDPAMRNILLTTPNGNSLYWRLSGLLLWMLALAGFRWSWLRYSAAMAGTVSLVVSFAVTGHVNNLGLIAQLAVSLHFLAVSCWVGSVFLLAYLLRPTGSTSSRLHHWYRWLTRYGQLAVPVLVAMFVSGGYLYVQLLGWSVLPRDPYHWLMFCKLSLVAGMLLVAARHKWHLVPAIAASLEPWRDDPEALSGGEEDGEKERGNSIGDSSDGNSMVSAREAIRQMRQSLFLEAVLAASILAIVAVMTTVVGPEMMSVQH